ncbi:hypothetical protein LIER_14542 [Lithospermum erythrorhizon]|uniref:Reverse transcriptase zinc-binding domain-containing protein n=1 Tax=Lithospermum erythrorhizon TaxID=34254 RepID=A0AAV3Q1W6_LITER
MVKHFAWRLYSDSLPSCTNLRKMGITVNDVCFLCGGKEAISIHSFQQCPYVVEVNNLLRCPIPTNIFVDSKDLLEFFHVNMDWRDFNCWLIGMWVTWHQRNLTLNGEVIRQPGEVPETL